MYTVLQICKHVIPPPPPPQGSGKTLAFGLPILQHILDNDCLVCGTTAVTTEHAQKSGTTAVTTEHAQKSGTSAVTTEHAQKPNTKRKKNNDKADRKKSQIVRHQKMREENNIIDLNEVFHYLETSRAEEVREREAEDNEGPDSATEEDEDKEDTLEEKGVHQVSGLSGRLEQIY